MSKSKADAQVPLGRSPLESTRILLLALALFAGIQLLCAYVPGIRTWGVDYWSSFPPLARWALALVLVLSVVPWIARPIANVVDRISGWRWASTAALGVAAVMFVVFRSRALAYGDGYSFAGYLKDGRFPEFEAQLWSMPLDLTVHWVVYRLIVLPFGGSVPLAYAITSAAGGVVGLAAVWRMSALVAGRDSATRRLIAWAGLSSGTVALWFGYVEGYTLTGAASLWTVVWAMEAVAHRRGIALAWGLWILACAFHLLAVALLPVLIWATWASSHPPKSLATGWKAFGLFAGGFFGWGVATFIFSLRKPAVFVPWWPTPDSTYTAFSGHHLVDVLNQAFLVAPMAVLVLLVSASDRRGKSGAGGSSADDAQSRARSVLAVAAGSMWYFSFWVDPLLGGFRDWDLLAGFGILASLWAGAVLCCKTGRDSGSKWRWVPIAALAIVHTGSFVAIFQNETSGVMRVDRLVRQDVHYSGDFFRGTRLTPWAYILANQLDRNDLAVEHLGRRARLDSTNYTCWKNLGSAFQHMDWNDSAALYFERAVALHGPDESLCRGLGLLRYGMNDFSGARDAFTIAVTLSDTSYGDRIMLALSLQRLHDPGAADAILNEALAIDPRRFEVYYLLGADADDRKDTTAALRYYEDALRHGATDEDIYFRMTQLYQSSGHPDHAIDVAHQWEAHFPGSSRAALILGTGFIFLGQYDSAQNALQRSLQRSPREALATYYLATTYRHLGHADKAKELAFQATQLDSNLSLPYLELVYLAADAGDRPSAVAATQAYLKRAPGDSGMTYLQQFMIR